jgi:drug/metabolite transporter (DMT)-like permease
MPYLGEIAALATALCWTGSSMAFAIASRAAGPLPANQFRLLVAVPVLLLLAWLCTGQPWPAGIATDRLVLLVLSGLSGLVLGDIGLFHALATIGPRLSSVVMSSWPAFAVAIGAATGEAFGAGMLGGTALLMAGVLLVLLRSREGSTWNTALTPAQLAVGVAGALLGALGQAGGVVMSRLAMAAGADLPGGMDALQATVVRMVTALAGLSLIAALRGRPLAGAEVLRNHKALPAALVGAACGPIAGVWLSMVAAHRAASVGVAAALMATTPIFMMPVAAAVYGARVGWLGVLGTLLAVAGAIVVLLPP